ncbi:MAG: hypothetical protein PsegKO_08500 [Pseudohongiellaceae bacterium]|jgi:uncharacterized protein YdeI (BOF family)
MRLRNTALATAVAIGSIGGTLGAASAQAQDPNPYMRADDTWISISGTVDNVARDAFGLDYGNGMITVEMDDGDRDADAYALLAGDEVTVNGLVDDDFFETTTIEASSVYVDKLDTYFYASAVDEEDWTVWYNYPVDFGQVTIQGMVTEVNGSDFVINDAGLAFEVGVDKMAYNPLDDEGYQKIEVGDVVRVTGSMDSSIFDDDALEASAIMTLQDS